MKKHYLITIILLLLGICSYLFSYFYNIEKERKFAEILGHQKIHAKLAAKSFNELFEKMGSELYFLSIDQDIINLNKEGRDKLNNLYYVLKSEIQGITRTDSLGVITFTVPDSTRYIGVDISYQNHIKRIIKSHKPTTSGVFYTVQGTQALVIHYPVFKNNKYSGSIAFLLNFRNVAKNILDDIKIGKTGFAWMVSKDSIEIYSPYINHIGKSVYTTYKDNPNCLLLADNMVAGKEGVSSYSPSPPTNKTSGNITYYMPIKIIDNIWSIAICYSKDEITASLAQFRTRLVLIFIIMFVAGIFISFYFFRTQTIVKESKLRIAAEEALLKERTLLRTLIDYLPSGVFIKDREYRKILINPLHLESIKAHIQNYGLNTDMDIIGKTDFEVFPKDDADRFIIDDRKVIEEGISIINKEEEGYGPNKSKIWLLVSKVPLKNSDGKIIGMVGITTDITKQKNTQHDLIKAKEKAEESDRLKTSFLNNISHEIRTPLNAIIGFSNLIKEASTEDEKFQKFANIILESGKQLLLIITDIINISAIEAGQVKVNWECININEIIQLLYEQLKHKAELKKIHFSYKTALENNKASIITDQTKFIEILTNLVNNAIKFTNSGHVTYGYNLKDNFLEFFIEDTGIGIKPEFVHKIYNRFSQAETSFTNKYGGTGLGLSISKAYVEVLGGKIWFDTIVGSGTTFYFTIPYKL